MYGRKYCHSKEYAPIKFLGHLDGIICSSSSRTPPLNNVDSFFRQLGPDFEIGDDNQSVLSSVKSCYEGWWVGYMWGAFVAPLTTTCTKEESYPEHEQEMWVKVSHSMYGELCFLQLATQAIIHGMNKWTKRTKQKNNWCGWDCASLFFFKTRFMLLPMCGKKLWVGMVPMKVLESCSRTENVITYEH